MFQIVRTEKLIASVMFASGDAYDYLVTESEILDAETKLAIGEGILRWQPNFGSRNDRPEILHVPHIARVRAFVDVEVDKSHALVQLWCRRDDGRLYLGDPDDSRHLYRLDSLAEPPTGEPWADGYRRSFAEDSHGLLAGDVGLDDLGVTAVGRPDPADADMMLAAECTNSGARLCAGDAVELRELLDEYGRLYLAGLLPVGQRPRGIGEPARADA